jgi:hypothetical protein
MMIVLWTIWVYLVIGIITAKCYERRLCADIDAGKVSALKLDALRRQFGNERFWVVFSVATTLLYGLFVIRLLLRRGLGDVELHQD